MEINFFTDILPITIAVLAFATIVTLVVGQIDKNRDKRLKEQLIKDFAVRAIEREKVLTKRAKEHKHVT